MRNSYVQRGHRGLGKMLPLLTAVSLCFFLSYCDKSVENSEKIYIYRIDNLDKAKENCESISLDSFHFFVDISYSEFSEEDRRDKETMSFVLDRFLEDIILSACALEAGIEIDDQTIEHFIQLELTHMTFKLQTPDQQAFYRWEIKKRLLIRDYLRFEILGKIHITDEQIAAYYNQNIDAYTMESKFCIRQVQLESHERAKEFRATFLKSQKSFMEVAETFIEGHAHELAPCLPLNFFPEPFQKTIRKLRPGSISDVLKLDYGEKTLYHVLMLERKVPEVEYSLEETASKIKLILEKQEIEKQLNKKKIDFQNEHKVHFYEENLPFIYLSPEQRRSDP